MMTATTEESGRAWEPPVRPLPCLSASGRLAARQRLVLPKPTAAAEPETTPHERPTASIWPGLSYELGLLEAARAPSTFSPAQMTSMIGPALLSLQLK